MNYKNGFLFLAAILLLSSAQLLPVSQVLASDNVTEDAGLILVEPTPYPPYPPIPPFPPEPPVPPIPPTPPSPPEPDPWYYPWHHDGHWDFYHWPYGVRWPWWVSGKVFLAEPSYLYQPPYQYQPYQPPVYVPVINSFNASPSYIQSGHGIVLSWTTTNATSVTISPGIGSVQTTGSYNLSPSNTTTYTLTATSGGGTTSASTMVTVAPFVYSYTGSSAPVATVADPPATSPTTSVLTGGLSGISDNLGMVITLLGLLAVAIVAAVVLFVRRPTLAPAASGRRTGYAVATQTAERAWSTTPADRPRLEIWNGEHLSLSGKGSLGRSDFSTLLKPEKADLISRNHLKFTCEGDDCFIEDCGSTNGTKLNGSKIDNQGKYLLRDGDKIRLAGVVTLIFKS
jgi:FHA domain